MILFSLTFFKESSTLIARTDKNVAPLSFSKYSLDKLKFIEMIDKNSSVLHYTALRTYDPISLSEKCLGSIPNLKCTTYDKINKESR